MRQVEPHLPALGEEVMTACGGIVEYTGDTPCAWYQDGWIFFCSQECRERFERNPAESCLVENFSGKEN